MSTDELQEGEESDNEADGSKRQVLKKKWTEQTIKHGYAVVPNVLLIAQARLGINTTEFAVLIHLLMFWYGEGSMPHPSRKTIAERLNLDKRTVQRATARLEEEKLIKKTARYMQLGGRTTNTYDLSPLVEKLRQISVELDQAKSEAEAITKKVERRGGFKKDRIVLQKNEPRARTKES